ncbi:hypothetical protein CRG98_047772 [Punica granatum]|uniref:Uncharacterized protein n=1 Tax=Punica granatum TaxID=22663 RepID=A0A2I0HJE3_PUNGR|nr:hypothetical protein CRG98_047772 [Punica granatum]
MGTLWKPYPDIERTWWALWEKVLSWQCLEWKLPGGEAEDLSFFGKTCRCFSRECGFTYISGQSQFATQPLWVVFGRDIDWASSTAAYFCFELGFVRGYLVESSKRLNPRAIRSSEAHFDFVNWKPNRRSICRLSRLWDYALYW